MREIKFRAWDETAGTGRMVEWSNLLKWRAEIIFINAPREVTLMQYTGLKDKNGVELWENDLLELDKNRLCQIVWHKESGRWDLKFVSEQNITPKFTPCGIDNVRSRGEVIGNIHENKELL